MLDLLLNIAFWFQDVADIRNLSLVYTLAGGRNHFHFIINFFRIMRMTKNLVVKFNNFHIVTDINCCYSFDFYPQTIFSFLHWVIGSCFCVYIVVDCIDCAADGSVVNAVNEGINAARSILPIRRPWVMISVNDDEDLHFRKAGIVSLWFKSQEPFQVVIFILWLTFSYYNRIWSRWLSSRLLKTMWKDMSC